VHTDAGLAVEEHDWRGTKAGEREEQLRLYLDADRRRGFELGAQTPLMRLALFRMDQADYRFVWKDRSGWWPTLSLPSNRNNPRRASCARL
jgi:hypothetical protein